jgi:hypothetical protein
MSRDALGPGKDTSFVGPPSTLSSRIPARTNTTSGSIVRRTGPAQMTGLAYTGGIVKRDQLGVPDASMRAGTKPPGT